MSTDISTTRFTIPFGSLRDFFYDERLNLAADLVRNLPDYQAGGYNRDRVSTFLVQGFYDCNCADECMCHFDAHGHDADAANECEYSCDYECYCCECGGVITGRFGTYSDSYKLGVWGSYDFYPYEPLDAVKAWRDCHDEGVPICMETYNLLPTWLTDSTLELFLCEDADWEDIIAERWQYRYSSSEMDTEDYPEVLKRMEGRGRLYWTLIISGFTPKTAFERAEALSPADEVLCTLIADGVEYDEALAMAQLLTN